MEKTGIITEKHCVPNLLAETVSLRSTAPFQLTEEKLICRDCVSICIYGLQSNSSGLVAACLMAPGGIYI